MIEIETGFRPDERVRIAGIYWQAFGRKLGKVLGPDHRAIDFIAPRLVPEFALVARERAGNVVGIAGFRTAQGALIKAGLQDLVHVYGFFGATWRSAVLAALERDVQPAVFQMDGISVDTSARGLGIGTKLLDAIADRARSDGMSEVQLDVIDVNPRAKSLYERRGFRQIAVSKTGPLKHLLGFSSATRMRLPV